MFQTMKDYWWLLLLRGIVAVAFGVYTLLNPGISAVSLVLAFGVYAVVSGGFSVGLALFSGANSDDRVMLVLQGILSGLLGILVLTWPGITMISLLAAIIGFAFVNGILEIAVAFQWRDLWIGLSGVLSIIFAIYAFRYPGDGALAVVFAISIYAISVGVMLVIASFQVRSIGKALLPKAA